MAFVTSIAKSQVNAFPCMGQSQLMILPGMVNKVCGLLLRYRPHDFAGHTHHEGLGWYALGHHSTSSNNAASPHRYTIQNNGPNAN
jgi:hypothetical protein